MPLIDVPLAGQRINNSQPQIRQNFATLQTGLVVDHVDFTAVNAGKHNKVTFPSAVVPPAAAATEFTMYNAVAGLVNELHIRRGNAVGGYPITQHAFAAGTNGFSYLSSGLVIKFGQGITDIAGNATINLNAAALGPHYTAVPFIQITMVRNPPYPDPLSYSVHNVAAASFKMSCTYNNTNFNWFAIATV